MVSVIYYNDAYYIYYGHGQGKLVLFKGSCIKSNKIKERVLKGSVNEYKMETNISRAKSKIIAYGLSNPWDWFITLTISPAKFDRTNLPAYRKKLAKYLNNQKRIKGHDIKYLLVPELHADGKSWHLHGLLSGLPETELIVNDNGFLDWPGYNQRFGFCSLDKIKDPVKVVFYLTKYLTKQIGQAVSINRQSYYVSKGLKQGEILYQGPYHEKEPVEGFENDFVKVAWTHERKVLEGFYEKGLDELPEAW